MTTQDADRRAEMPDATPDGSGRNPQEHGLGASNVTAMKATSHPEPMQLMEAVVTFDNMKAALLRVEGNAGCAGADAMPAEQLRPYLHEHWPRLEYLFRPLRPLLAI